MIESGRITNRKLFIIVFLYTTGSAIIIIPTTLATQAIQDAWIVAIFGVTLGTVVSLLYLRLASLYPGMTLVEMCEQILGKIAGRLLAFLFITYFILLAGQVLRNIGDFISTNILYKTPIEVVHILFILVALFAVRLGLEVFARTAEIFIPLIIFLFTILVVFLTPEMNVKNLLPFFESGLKPMVKYALPILATPFLELFAFLMILPYVNEKNKTVKKSFLGGLIMGGALLIIVTTVSLLVFGAEITARNLYPTYLLGKEVSIGAFIQRIEVIVAVMWFITIFFKLTILVYITSLGMAQIFTLQNYRSLTAPICIIVVVLAFITSPNTGYNQHITLKVWPALSIIICLIFPLLLYVIAILRKKSRQS